MTFVSALITANGKNDFIDFSCSTRKLSKEKRMRSRNEMPLLSTIGVRRHVCSHVASGVLSFLSRCFCYYHITYTYVFIFLLLLLLLLLFYDRFFTCIPARAIFCALLRFAFEILRLYYVSSSNYVHVCVNSAPCVVSLCLSWVCPISGTNTLLMHKYQQP